MEFFIAGTDTGAGKTFVTAALASSLLIRGIRTGVQKWVTTGNSSQSEDIEWIRSMVTATVGSQALKDMVFSSPYCLSLPASPHLASEIDSVDIDIQYILSEYHRASSLTDILLVEGTGGVMVPITRKLLYADLLQQINPMVILVARSGLGTINHTLLTIEALRKRGLNILCVVLNSIDATGKHDETSKIIVEDNIRIIADIGRVEVFGPLPFMSDPLSKRLLQYIEPVIDRIMGACPDG